MKKMSLICLKLFILSILSTAVFLVISDYKVIKNTVKAAPQCTPFPRIEVKNPVKSAMGVGTVSGLFNAKKHVRRVSLKVFSNII